MKILKFPEIRQAFDWDCGANALQSVCMYYGIDISEDEIMQVAKTDKTGTLPTKMKAVAKKYQLDAKEGKMTVDDIKASIDNKIPVILLVQAWTQQKNVDWQTDWNDGHYVVAIGYDAKKIIFEDPSAIRRTYLTYQELLERWHHIDRNGKKFLNWGMAVHGKKAHDVIAETEHMD